MGDKGHFSGRAPKGSGGKELKDPILYISERQKDHSGMRAHQSITKTPTVQAQKQQKLSCPQAGSKQSNCHERVVRTGAKATCADQ